MIDIDQEISGLPFMMELDDYLRARGHHNHPLRIGTNRAVGRHAAVFHGRHYQRRRIHCVFGRREH